MAIFLYSILIFIYHTDMDLECKGDAESLTKVAVLFIRKNLPEYIVNCFLAAGSDTLPIIAEMDVSDEPGNSLKVIEEFNIQMTQSFITKTTRLLCCFHLATGVELNDL